MICYCLSIMNVKFHHILYMLCFMSFFVSSGVFSAQNDVEQNKTKNENQGYEDKDVMLRFVSFTPQQIVYATANWFVL